MEAVLIVLFTILQWVIVGYTIYRISDKADMAQASADCVEAELDRYIADQEKKIEEDLIEMGKQKITRIPGNKDYMVGILMGILIAKRNGEYPREEQKVFCIKAMLDYIGDQEVADLVDEILK